MGSNKCVSYFPATTGSPRVVALPYKQIPCVPHTWNSSLPPPQTLTAAGVLLPPRFLPFPQCNLVGISLPAYQTSFFRLLFNLLTYKGRDSHCPLNMIELRPFRYTQTKRVYMYTRTHVHAHARAFSFQH